jgi:hypothetical protein
LPTWKIKIIVMKKMIPFLVLLAIQIITQAQNVGVGTSTPQQKLDVNGAIKIGSNGNAAPSAGTIRWNQEKNIFEGFNGAQWIDFTGGMNGWGHSTPYVTENEGIDDLLDAITNYQGTNLGLVMAAYGNVVLAGAPLCPDQFNADKGATGSVRMMFLTSKGWEPLIIRNPDPETYSSYFGSSVAMDASRFVVGEPEASAGNYAKAGRVHIYRYTSNNAVLEATIAPGSPQQSAKFGRAVGISGDYMAVSSPHRDVGMLPVIGSAGSVNVYHWQGNNWVATATLTAPDRAEGDQFGQTLYMDGEYLAVGVELKKINNLHEAGKVYVYRRTGTAWDLIAQLTSPGGISFAEKFGSALAIHNGTLVIGTFDNNTFDPSRIATGKVYVYTLAENTVTYQQTLTASDGKNADRFGSSVAIRGDVLAVGARTATVQSKIAQGKVYAFKKTAGQWKETAILTASNGNDNDHFGTAVALPDNYCAASSPRADVWVRPDNGRVYFFKRP